LTAALGLAIMFEWPQVEKYLDREIHNIDPPTGNHTGSGDGGDDLVAEESAYSSTSAVGMSKIVSTRSRCCCCLLPAACCLLPAACCLLALD